jgi:hypothetical protein
MRGAEFPQRKLAFYPGSPWSGFPDFIINWLPRFGGWGGKCKDASLLQDLSGQRRCHSPRAHGKRERVPA